MYIVGGGAVVDDRVCYTCMWVPPSPPDLPRPPRKINKKKQAVRNETKLADVFSPELLESPSPSQPGYGLLDYVAGVDVTDAATLGPGVFAEADHVRFCFVGLCWCAWVGWGRVLDWGPSP